jgi:hypothetical protein
MEELIKSAIELYKLLPESLNWLAFVIAPLMLGGLIAYRYTFPGGQPNLLTVGERRRRDRIKFIEECLASAHNSDENVVAALREERMSLIFQEISGLKLKAPMRQQLVLLHEKSTSRDTWGEINTGFDSLKEQDGKLVKGVDRVNGVFGAFAGLFGILMIVIGCFFFVYIAAAGARVSPQTLKLGFLVASLYLGAGFLGLRFGLPALRAKQLQKYIPAEGCCAMRVPRIFAPKTNVGQKFLKAEKENGSEGCERGHGLQRQYRQRPPGGLRQPSNCEESYDRHLGGHK